MDKDGLRPFLSLELWSVREAAYLLCDKLPAGEREFISNERDEGGPVAHTYRALKDATLAGTVDFIKADAADTLMRRRVRPADAVAWATTRGINVPAALHSVESGRRPATGSKKILPAVNVPRFVCEARPLQVPPELCALPPETFVQWEDSTGIVQVPASEVRACIEEVIARQAEGFFTVDEAAQVLAQSRAGTSAKQWAMRMRRAQRADVPAERLMIRDGTRLPMGPGETGRDFCDLVKSEDIDEWLQRTGAGFAFPGVAPLTGGTKRTSATAEGSAPDWVPLAKDKARDIIKRQSKQDLYPSQLVIADTIATDFLREGVFGPSGKPLRGETIKRHALKGISSAAKKGQSTGSKRGK